ncbi:MAG: transposase [Planctomycetes bacterium]|nr:transposase [Planctomycetota bacterium]
MFLFRLRLLTALWGAARDRERLEKLCRYAGRPAIAELRLRLLADGRVAYSLKKRWQDGTSHVVLTPQVLMERRCALVVRPKQHPVTYCGVLAPAAGLRPRVGGDLKRSHPAAGIRPTSPRPPEPVAAAAMRRGEAMAHAPPPAHKGCAGCAHRRRLHRGAGGNDPSERADGVAPGACPTDRIPWRPT